MKKVIVLLILAVLLAGCGVAPPAQETMEITLEVRSEVDPPEGIEIWKYGLGTWRPTLESGKDRISVEVPIGEAEELYIYPEGEEDIVVTIEATENILVGSVRIVVREDMIIVSSPMIGGELVFDRVK